MIAIMLVFSYDKRSHNNLNYPQLISRWRLKFDVEKRINWLLSDFCIQPSALSKCLQIIETNLFKLFKISD